MEDNQNQQQSAPIFSENPSNGISFPTVNQPKKSGGPKTLLIVGILILVGILGFVIYKSATNKTDTTLSEPTPFDNLTAPVTNTVESTTTPTPIASVKPTDKSTVSIEVQNGTGITGEAAYLQTQLKTLGYTKVTVGNAGSQTQTVATVTFSDSVSTDVVTEITQKLNSIYQTVTTKTTTSKTATVLIVTGLRKGSTPKPSATTTASASPSATPKATATPTSTP